MDEDEILLGELWEKLEPRIDDAAADAYRDFSPEERVFMLVFWYRLDSENGGADQFLWNSGGDLLEETIAALEVIGADRTAGYLRKIAARFAQESGERLAADLQARRAQIERYGPDELRALCAKEFENLSTAPGFTWGEALTRLAPYAKRHLLR
jgi:hypothetical protein